MFQQPTSYLKESTLKHLRTRPLTLDDISVWVNFYINNPSLIFFPFLPDGSKEYKATKWIERQLERYKNKEFGLMALIDLKSDLLIGQCGLLTQEIDEQKVLEIGYHILPQHWGKGLASEAAKAFKTYAFKNKLADEVVSIIHIDNIGSQKVAEKNGMKKGKRTQFHNIPVDIYSINNKG